jgi:GDPmannose 4,6-dehydratase
MGTRRALITGITGQDGSYLAEFLLEKGYQVHGLIRQTAGLSRSRLAHLYRDPTIHGQHLFLHCAGLDDPATLRRVLSNAAPDELYHLAGQSHVGKSFETPEATCEVISMGTLRLLEVIRELTNPPRFFYASSSEIFGSPTQSPQDELTPLSPVNPYGCAKAFATQMVRIYRATHQLFACNGIMYNHESPRRGESFVTRKICRAAARIRLGLQTELRVGNVSALRDWGDARDYVRGMWLTLQHNIPDDFVFATGQVRRVQDVVEVAFRTLNLDWQKYVKRDAGLMRAREPVGLVGDATKARHRLGWAPQSHFSALITEITTAELMAFTKHPNASSNSKTALSAVDYGIRTEPGSNCRPEATMSY